MRGITEERLVEILGTCNLAFEDFIESLIDECQELTPWQSIETAPKDRPLLLLSGGTSIEGSWVHGEGFWMQHWTHDEIKPTHWQELPEDPKE